MQEELGKTLLFLGALLFVAGAFLYFGGGSLLQRLPGDFKWEGKNVTVYFPLATSILLSVVFTLLAQMFFRR